MSKKIKTSDVFTCNVDRLGRAPKRIELLGDKTLRPESAQHVIEFPGGAIEVSRTSTGEYWCHIHVNRDWADGDMQGIRGAMGKVVGGRLDFGEGVEDVPNQDRISQIAILIRAS